MRSLGVDYGTVRVGLALSDEIGMLATPLETVERAKAVQRIQEVVRTRDVGTVILGMPRNMDGSYGPKAKEVEQFAEELRKAGVNDLKFWDERLTTRSAERMLVDADVSRKRRKEVIDKLAAQQILQSYLDSKTM